MRNPHAPVKEIVKLLHKYQIPLSLLNNVFDLVRIDIEQNTIPYNPDGDDKHDDFILNIDDLPTNSHAFINSTKE